jgi:alkylation response protein AidB-like acyl-CoA dehydrogenase
MTFDLSPEQAADQARARELAAAHLAPAADAIDRGGRVPTAILEMMAGLDLHTGDGDRLTALLVVEELAAVSASAAARAALGNGPDAGLAGLRGVARVERPEPRHYLLMAAVCIGIGRAALSEALRAARARGDRPAGEPGDPPHWALADAATDVDAARLLLHAEASGSALSPAAVLVNAAAAATRAVDAALRIVGVNGYAAGGALERCGRDARAAVLLFGGEDPLRRLAADTLLG